MASVTAPSITKRVTKPSRLWWRVHQWVGFKLSIFLAFIFFTGTVAVLSAEIDWLLHPSLRVSPSSVEGPVQWSKIAENAAAHLNVKQISYMSEPTASAFAVRVSVTWADDSIGFLHAHPTTGVIQGSQGFVDTQRIFRNLHRHLNLPTQYGVPLVSALSILMLISFVTSFIVYKKWWRGFFKPVRWRNARTVWVDIHRLAGVWSLWFVLLIALTGLWYLVESLGGEAPVKDGQTLLATDAQDLNVHQRISEMADPLHFGTFGGYWTKIIWFLFGLFLTGLAVSGIAIYGLRVGRDLTSVSQAPSGWAVAWRGMGNWRWVALGCVAIGLLMLPTLFE
ncbi:MAG: PepSY domain-containing protein [Sphingopyxis sp.]|nr:PepSY domain-containing protein [Sphingopyxis sp.]